VMRRAACARPLGLDPRDIAPTHAGGNAADVDPWLYALSHWTVVPTSPSTASRLWWAGTSGATPGSHRSGSRGAPPAWPRARTGPWSATWGAPTAPGSAVTGSTGGCCVRGTSFRSPTAAIAWRGPRPLRASRSDPATIERRRAEPPMKLGNSSRSPRHDGQKEGGSSRMDATRPRRTRDDGRKRWYASHRRRRFARFVWGLSLVQAPSPAQGRSREDHTALNVTPQRVHRP